MSLTITKINTTDGFLHLRQEWSLLLDHSPSKSAFLTWEWLFTWWEHLGRDKDLYLLTAREGQELVGIAPLMLTTSRRLGFKTRMLRNLGMPDTDVAGFILKSGRLDVQDAFLTWIENRCYDWDIFELGEFPNHPQPPESAIRCFSSRSYRTRLMPKIHILIATNGQWESYYRSLSRHHRRSMRRKETLINEAGSVLRFERYNHGNAKPEHLEEIFTINAKARFPGLYAIDELRRFHLALLKPGNLHEAVDISFLRFDEKIIAFEYGFIYNNIYEAWRGAFDPEFAFYSPGNLIFLNLLKDNFEHKIAGIDLLRGEHEYKKRWGGDDHPYTLLWVIPRRQFLTTLLFFWLPNLRKKIAGWVQQPAAPEADL